MATYQPPAGAPPRAANAHTAPASNPSIPPGTFAPGTKVQVGKHRVIIERYLSEGGFAHVYVVQVPLADGKSHQAVLKRVAVPDKETLSEMRTEVETMKKLRGHKYIVTYMDSHASGLKAGGYEVFLLMEYCDGGGLIDFMNTRLKNRLTEPEILHIFSDAAEGVACMHYLKPPLLHRDLKVENILITNTPSGKEYKLCDFGSSAPPRPAATTAAEGRLIEDDVQRHTTFQYRSPEMIDVYRKRPIDEKSDIWALGVLLYKLCYYTTPFEEQGQMAILTASFKYPPQPRFSDRLKLLIATMLSEDPQKRPNIYQVISQVCAMRGKQVPLKDIYSARTPSEVRSHQQLPPREPQVQSPPPVGAYQASPEPKKQAIPEITPMRRGRPTASTDPKQSTNVSSSEVRKSTDPFAALDSSNYATRAKAVSELSSKYPALDEFSLLQDKGATFQFQDRAKKDEPQPLNKRLTNALADEAFAGARSISETATRPTQVASDVARQASLKGAASRGATLPPAKDATSGRPLMVSTGTMTSPIASSRGDFTAPLVEHKPIWRVPSDASRKIPSTAEPLPQRNSSWRSSVAHSPTGLDGTSRSSRHSTEGGRPGLLDVAKPTHRSKSAETQRRIVTGEEPPPRSPSAEGFRGFGPERPSSVLMDDAPPSWQTDSEDNISSNMEYLKTREEEDAAKGHHRRHTSLNKIKQASIPRGGRRNLLSGKFGEAFKLFDMNAGGYRTPSPNPAVDSDGNDLWGTNADEPSDSQKFDDEDIAETEELSPEMRRELERRRLSQEEKRVAEAQAAYRQQLARGESGKTVGSGVTRASTIQNRVKNLLDETERGAPVTKTAEGYGRYTESSTIAPRPESPTLDAPVADLAPAPPNSAPPTTAAATKQRLPPLQALPTRTRGQPPGRPTAPPKPESLRTASTVQSPRDMKSGSATTADDWEEDFSKRYPSLSLEMVETEIGTGDTASSRPAGLRIKDV